MKDRNGKEIGPGDRVTLTGTVGWLWTEGRIELLVDHGEEGYERFSPLACDVERLDPANGGGSNVREGHGAGNRTEADQAQPAAQA